MTRPAPIVIHLDEGLPTAAARGAEPAAAEILILIEGPEEIEPALEPLLDALADPRLAAATTPGVPAVLAMRRTDADLLETTVAARGQELAALRRALTPRGRVETIRTGGD